MKKNGYRIFNGLAFYFGWFYIVYFAAKGIPYRGLALASVLVAIHLIITPKRLQEGLLILFLVFVGFIVETAFVNFGVLKFAGSIGPFAPPWILGLYALFGTTLNTSLFWLRRYPYASSVFGAGGGVISYTAGQVIGAVDFLLPGLWSQAILGAAWFMMLPLFYLVNARIRHEKNGH